MFGMRLLVENCTTNVDVVQANIPSDAKSVKSTFTSVYVTSGGDASK